MYSSSGSESYNVYTTLFLCLQPPQICTYQWATYTIIITGQGVREEIVIVRIGPNNYSNDDVIMEKIVSPGLEMDKQYSIEVIVETRAGNTTAGATFSESHNQHYVECM